MYILNPLHSVQEAFSLGLISWKSAALIESSLFLPKYFLLLQISHSQNMMFWNRIHAQNYHIQSFLSNQFFFIRNYTIKFIFFYNVGHRIKILMINIPSQQSDLVPNITSISAALKENWFVKLNFPVKLQFCSFIH